MILKYFLKGRNKIKYSKDSTLQFNNAKIKSTLIYVSESSQILLGKNCIIDKCDINLNKGILIIGNNVCLRNANIKINNGCVEIKDNARIMCNIWTRFGGKLIIGEYSNINLNSEIRCDQEVVIGDYTQISYNVNIWDTNTHSIYPPNKRRELSKTIGIGNEIEKPDTKPIIIGNDCWIAKNSTIMKGSSIGNNVIIGYGTTIINNIIKSDTIVVPKIELKYKSNKKD